MVLRPSKDVINCQPQLVSRISSINSSSCKKSLQSCRVKRWALFGAPKGRVSSNELEDSINIDLATREIFTYNMYRDLKNGLYCFCGLVWVLFMELWGPQKPDDFHYWLIIIPVLLIFVLTFDLSASSMHHLASKFVIFSHLSKEPLSSDEWLVWPWHTFYR